MDKEGGALICRPPVAGSRWENGRATTWPAVGVAAATKRCATVVVPAMAAIVRCRCRSYSPQGVVDVAAAAAARVRSHTKTLRKKTRCYSRWHAAWQGSNNGEPLPLSQHGSSVIFLSFLLKLNVLLCSHTHTLKKCGKKSVRGGLPPPFSLITPIAFHLGGSSTLSTCGHSSIELSNTDDGHEDAVYICEPKGGVGEISSESARLTHANQMHSPDGRVASRTDGIAASSCAERWTGGKPEASTPCG